MKFDQINILKMIYSFINIAFIKSVKKNTRTLGAGQLDFLPDILFYFFL